MPDLCRFVTLHPLTAREGAYPIEIVTTPQLSIVSFRVRRIPGEAIDAWNDRNMTFLKRINATGRTILSSTWLPSGNEKVLAIRACILSYRTHAKDVENCLDDIRLAAVHQSRS
jgi:hypothetical protein